jgi:hypothetical protein
LNSGLADCCIRRSVSLTSDLDVTPKHGKSKLGIDRFYEGTGDAIAATHIFRRAIDQIAEQPSAIVQLNEGYNVGLLALGIRAGSADELAGGTDRVHESRYRKMGSGRERQ